VIYSTTYKYGERMATTYELIIYGKVQHVGFRERIEYIGKILGINGIIYNHKDGTVRILANFDSERKKKLFKELIKELEEVDNLIKIEKIEEKILSTYIDFPEGINRISTKLFKKVSSKQDGMLRFAQHPLLDSNRFLLFPISDFSR